MGFIQSAEGLKSKTEVSLRKKFYLWMAMSAPPASFLLCGFGTCLANSHNHVIQFFAINLLKYLQIYIHYWLYFSNRTLTDTEYPVGPLIPIRHGGGEGRHKGEGHVKTEAEIIVIQPQTSECLYP